MMPDSFRYSLKREARMRVSCSPERVRKQSAYTSDSAQKRSMTSREAAAKVIHPPDGRFSIPRCMKAAAHPIPAPRSTARKTETARENTVNDAIKRTVRRAAAGYTSARVVYAFCSSLCRRASRGQSMEWRILTVTSRM